MSYEVTNFFLDLPRDQKNFFSVCVCVCETEKNEATPPHGSKNKIFIKNIFISVLNVFKKFLKI